eukprot:11039956-Lingulodinium_polyedra.AAC.1
MRLCHGELLTGRPPMMSSIVLRGALSRTARSVFAVPRRSSSRASRASQMWGSWSRCFCA